MASAQIDQDPIEETLPEACAADCADAVRAVVVVVVVAIAIAVVRTK